MTNVRESTAKLCLTCEMPFFKRKNAKNIDWAKRKFCSVLCSRKFHWDRFHSKNC